MARLRVMKGSAIVQEVALDQGQTYLAGRADNCQIRLDPEPGISRQHFQIQEDDGTWKLEVLSRYGELYVNGQKTPKLELHEHQKFSVPPYDFIFMSGSISQVDNSDEATAIAQIKSVGYLRVIDERGVQRQTYRLEGEAWTAGRDGACAILLDTAKASRQHFEIYIDKGHYFARDLGSANGTLVNGHAISKSEWTRLQSGDTLTVVDWTVKFELRDPTFDRRVQDLPESAKANPIYQESVGFEAHNSNESQDFSGQTHYGQMPHPAPPTDSWQQVSEPVRSHQMAPPPPPMPPPPARRFGFGGGGGKKVFTPIRIVMAVVVVGAGVFALLDSDENTKRPEPKKIEGGTTATDKPKTKSPFDNLSPEDQQFVRRAYENSRQSLMDKKYAESLQEINRIKEKLAFYEDSKEIEKAANEGLARLDQLKQEEQVEKANQEAEVKMQKQLQVCKQQINPETVTMATLETCLSSVIVLNPDHPGINSLRAEVQRMMDERASRKVHAANYQAEVHKLDKLYDKARGFLNRKKISDGVEALQKVVESKLPDPKGLKEKAKQEREQILSGMASAQKKLEAQADNEQREGHYKEAVRALREALDINPDNEVVKGHLTAALLELRKLMQPIYQESIVEESVGDVEKAKDKWKKIIDASIVGEEYYEKSRLKLKKYGAM